MEIPAPSFPDRRQSEFCFWTSFFYNLSLYPTVVFGNDKKAPQRQSHRLVGCLAGLLKFSGEEPSAEKSSGWRRTLRGEDLRLEKNPQREDLPVGQNPSQAQR